MAVGDIYNGRERREGLLYSVAAIGGVLVNLSEASQRGVSFKSYRKRVSTLNFLAMKLTAQHILFQ